MVGGPGKIRMRSSGIYLGFWEFFGSFTAIVGSQRFAVVLRNQRVEQIDAVVFRPGVAATQGVGSGGSKILNFSKLEFCRF